MRSLALFLVALPLCGACSKLESSRTELWLRHVATADRIDVLLLSEGVSARSQDGADVARRLISGERRIYCGWPFDWDLDDPDRFRTREDFELFRAVDLLWAVAYLDAQGRLAIAQHFRIRDAGRVVARLNELIRESLLADAAEGEADSGPYKEAQRAFVLAGRDVLTFEEGRLSVAFPSTPQESWEFEQALKYGRGVQGVTAWKVEESAMVFHLGERGRAEWSLSYEPKEMTYDPDLRQELELQELLHPDLTKDALLERFRTRASEPATEPDPRDRRPIDED